MLKAVEPRRLEAMTAKGDGGPEGEGVGDRASLVAPLGPLWTRTRVGRRAGVFRDDASRCVRVARITVAASDRQAPLV